ncbi:MAG: hypothetical protein WC375_07245 [Methanomassiliicoccales archaeon]|jgi:hypothetical protein
MSRTGIPIGVAVVGVLAFLGGLFWITIGTAAVLVSGDEVMYMVVGVLGVFFGLAFLLFGLGCLKGWGWVWTLGIVLSIIGILLSVFGWYQEGFSGAATASSLVSVLIQLFILIYLTTNKVKLWFNKL